MTMTAAQVGMECATSPGHEPRPRRMDRQCAWYLSLVRSGPLDEATVALI